MATSGSEKRGVYQYTDQEKSPGVSFQSSMLPEKYGEDIMVLMARDPGTLFAYWEITREKVRNVLEKAGRAFDEGGMRYLLRVKCLDEGADHTSRSLEWQIPEGAKSWYVNGISSSTRWKAEIGAQLPDGSYHTLVKSNMARTPSDRISDETDQEWGRSEKLYYRFFLSQEMAPGTSSLDVSIRQKVTEHLKKWLFSGPFSSFK